MLQVTILIIIAGLNAHKILAPDAPLTCIHLDSQVRKATYESRNDSIPTPDNFSKALSVPKMPLTPPAEPGADPSSYCTHRCKDKSQCKHLCCKGTVKRRRQSKGPESSTPLDLVDRQANRRERIGGRAQLPTREQDYHGDDHNYVVCEGVSPVEALLNYISAFQGVEN